MGHFTHWITFHESILKLSLTWIKLINQALIYTEAAVWRHPLACLEEGDGVREEILLLSGCTPLRFSLDHKQFPHGSRTINPAVRRSQYSVCEEQWRNLTWLFTYSLNALPNFFQQIKLSSFTSLHTVLLLATGCFLKLC